MFVLRRKIEKNTGKERKNKDTSRERKRGKRENLCIFTVRGIVKREYLLRAFPISRLDTEVRRKRDLIKIHDNPTGVHNKIESCIPKFVVWLTVRVHELMRFNDKVT